MTAKTAPLGICDLCGLWMPDPYTSKRQPRRYCSVECRNTGNSRAGAAIISRKTRQRIASGAWQNPAALNPPDSAEQARRARLGRQREVEAGTWHNPALSPQARAKLSRPRKYSGALHSAIEKLSAGAKMAALTPAEIESHRAWQRARYRERQAALTPEQREYQREQWRQAWRRRKQK